MQQTLVAMRETTKTAVDVQAWTQAYPWPSVGAGLFAGFMASALLPSGKQADQPRSRSALFAFIQTSLLGVIRSTVISTATSAFFSQPFEADLEQPDNGSSTD